MSQSKMRKNDNKFRYELPDGPHHAFHVTFSLGTQWSPQIKMPNGSTVGQTASQSVVDVIGDECSFCSASNLFIVVNHNTGELLG